jgi:copper resistance protein C
MTSSTHRPFFARTAGVLALVGFLVANSTGASAHNAVEDRSPEPGATVTSSPVTVSIATNDEFLDLGGDARGFAIVGIDEGGLFYGDGCVEIIERRMVAEVPLGQAGTYTIAYQFVSADGHSLSDSYTITFVPGPDHVASEGHTAAPVCSPPASVEETTQPGDEPNPALEDATATEDGSVFELSVPTIAGLVVLVVVAVGLIVSGARARKGRD